MVVHRIMDLGTSDTPIINVPTKFEAFLHAKMPGVDTQFNNYSMQCSLVICCC
jgi:hypothetical protein